MLRIVPTTLIPLRETLAVVLATSIAVAAVEARSEIISNDVPVGPISNGLHLREGIVLDSDCAPAPSAAYDANYRAGVDAYGNPVIPAEAPRRSSIYGLGAVVPLGESEAYIDLAPDDDPAPASGDCAPLPPK